MLADMLRWFHNYCEKHGLRYYMVAGTMLGAARHQGIIPWDDDIDVAMPRPDYEKLIELLRKPQDSYVVESPKYHAGRILLATAKLYHTGTTLVEKNKCPIKKGIYIDIFPLDGVGNSLEEGLQSLKKVIFLDNLRAAKVCSVRKGRSLMKNAVAFFGGLLPLRMEKLVRKIDDVCARRNFDDCEYVAIMTSTYRQKDIMPKSYFGTPTLYSFEGFEACGVEQADAYLTHLYGDWRQFPPEEQRVTRHEAIYMNLSEPYM